MSDRFSKLGYVTNPLDRRCDLRDRPEALAALRAQDDAGVLVFAGDVSLLKRQGDALEGLFSPNEVKALGTTRATLFLGLDGTRPLFADEIEAEAAERFADDARVMVIDARSIRCRACCPRLSSARSRKRKRCCIGIANIAFARRVARPRAFQARDGSAFVKLARQNIFPAPIPW